MNFDPATIASSQSGRIESRRRRFSMPPLGQIRLWGTKSTVSLIDQAFTSAAGFSVNLLLARWMTASEYGAFAVAFAGYLFLTLFHNALLLEPLSVLGPSRHAQHLSLYFRAQLGIHSVLVWPLTLLSLAAAGIIFRFSPHSPLVGALIGGGIALPLLLLLWLVRRMCYVVQRPSMAVTGSSVYFVFSVGMLFVLHRFGRISPAIAFVAMAVGSLLGASLILLRAALASSGDTSRARVEWTGVFSENWKYGRWLVGSALLYSVSAFAQTFFVAGALGLAAAGILRAMQVPSLVMTQCVTAIGLLVLPHLSYEFGKGNQRTMRRKAMLVSVILGTAALCFAALLALGDNQIQRLLYGGKYAEYARLIPILALIPASNGLCTGYSMALRASQKPFYDLLSNAFAAIVAVVSTILFVRAWGVLGAAFSMVLSFAVMNAMAFIFFSALESGIRPEKAAKLARLTSEAAATPETRRLQRIALQDDV